MGFADSRGKLRAQSNALRVLVECGGNERIARLRTAPALQQKTGLHRLMQEMVADYNMQESSAREVCEAVWVAFCGSACPLPPAEPTVQQPRRETSPQKTQPEPKPKPPEPKPQPVQKPQPMQKPEPVRKPQPMQKHQPMQKPEPMQKPQPPKNPQQDEIFSWPEFYVTEEEAKYGGKIRTYFQDRPEMHTLPSYREIQPHKRGDGVRISSGVYLDHNKYWKYSDGVLRAYLRGGWIRDFLGDVFDGVKWFFLPILIMVVYGFIAKAKTGVFPELPFLAPFALTPSIHLYKPSGWFGWLYFCLLLVVNIAALIYILAQSSLTIGDIKKARNELQRRKTL